MLYKSKKRCIFAPPKAQMAESVDALVSNTSGFTSIPVRPRVWVLKKAVDRLIDSLYYLANKQIIFPQAQKI